MTIKEEAIQQLLIKTVNHPNDLGLLNGQMGVVIVLAQCAKQWEMPFLDYAAEFIYNHISNSAMSLADNISFASGLSGIGWGIEYLIQKQLMIGSGDEICVDIDKKIMTYNITHICNMELSNGLIGIWKYIQARITGNINLNIAIPFNHDYLNDWLTIMSHQPMIFSSNDTLWLKGILSGMYHPMVLSLTPYICQTEENSYNKICLYNGLAGLIATKYLSSI